MGSERDFAVENTALSSGLPPDCISARIHVQVQVQNTYSEGYE
jgi:predicted amidohydrolase